MNRIIGTTAAVLLLCAVSSHVSALQICRDNIPATTPDIQFTDNGDGTVTDHATGLMWKQCPEGRSGTGCASGSVRSFTWQQALNLAESADFASYSDWRLPNKSELSLLVERSCRAPAINARFFPYTTGPNPKEYWSSSPHAYSLDKVWVVGFSRGLVVGYGKYSQGSVRLVRVGQAGGGSTRPEMDDPYITSILGYTTQPLNDTGITLCGNATRNDLPCPVHGFPGQDAEYGRDVTDNDPSDGNAGFSFTKLDINGNDLPTEATVWSCVRDNVTGLVWEGKTDSGGLHDADNTYTWFNPDSTINGGDAGTQNGGACVGSACDTDAFVETVNAQGLCGASDWRMPNVQELMSIVDSRRGSPAYSAYFRNTRPGLFVSSQPYPTYADFVYYVRMLNSGRVDAYLKSIPRYVRLVRAGG